MTQRVRCSGAFPRRARAFTMIELMITMIIITIVISILVPALGGVRDTARAGSTRALMNDVVNASAKFELDKRRLPGVFSPQDLGGAQNGNTSNGRGLSAMENLIADLAGGVVAAAPAPAPVNTVVMNPTTDPTRDVYVDTKQIGTGKNIYFVPPPKFYAAQHNEGGAVMQQFGAAGHTAPEGTDQIPDLVDAWRQPILAWVKDETAITPVDGVNTFLVRENSGTTAAPTPAKYYWASNAAFLRATSLGRKGKDQTFVNADIAHSLIGGGVPVLDAARRLDAILGNPNYAAFYPPNAAPTHPGEGRAPLILHSAGSDGFYFGSKDKGAGRVSPMPLASGATPYSCHFMLPGGSWATDRWKDKNGQITIDDVTSDFDDMLATGSN
ncbi:MAG: prepilin-type N-terminal cleavage/methylation domain-containing protein [Phycisphaerales bacterium]